MTAVLLRNCLSVGQIIGPRSPINKLNQKQSKGLLRETVRIYEWTQNQSKTLLSLKFQGLNFNLEKKMQLTKTFRKNNFDFFKFTVYVASKFWKSFKILEKFQKVTLSMFLNES